MRRNGQAAVRLLLEVIEADGRVFTPWQLVLRPELLVRNSSARLAQELVAAKRLPNVARRRATS